MGRPRRDPGETREAVRALLEQRLSRAEIATRLEISKPTVTYHARKLGLVSDSRFRARQFDWPAIARAYDSGLSMRECMNRFGFSSSAWALAVKRGDVRPRPRELALDRLLVRGTRNGRGNLKRRLLAAGLKEDRCEECGVNEWRGRALAMALHHVNGDGTDNRLENLQLLCPNCHSQTENFAGRNRGRRRPTQHPSNLGAGT
jgi:hypothetical protein